MKNRPTIVGKHTSVQLTGRKNLLHCSWWATILLLCSCSVLQGQKSHVTAPDAERQDIARAASLYDQGRMQEAEPLLRKILSQDPQSEPANEMLGLIYAQQGAIERALPYLTRAAEAPSSSATNHANLGAALLKLGRPTAALRELKVASRLDPGNAETASELGQAYMLNHDPAEGAKAFAAAARAAPPGSDLLYNWALALFDAGQTQSAASVLARISSADMSAEADSLAADVDERLGHFMPAVKHYQSAAAKDPSEVNLYALALEFLHHWTWAEARKVATFGTTKYPESKRMQLALGIAEYGSGQYPQAAAIFSTLLQSDPENAKYADLLGRSCSRISDSQNAACGQIIDFAERHPKNASICTYAAEQILHQPGSKQDMEVAKRLLKNAIAADPKLPEAYYQMGSLYLQERQLMASADMLKKAIALRPSYASAHYHLAQVYARQKEPEKAKEEIELQKKYNQQETARLDANLKGVSIFLPAPSK